MPGAKSPSRSRSEGPCQKAAGIATITTLTDAVVGANPQTPADFAASRVDIRPGDPYPVATRASAIRRAARSR